MDQREWGAKQGISERENWIERVDQEEVVMERVSDKIGNVVGLDNDGRRSRDLDHQRMTANGEGQLVPVPPILP